MGDSNNRLRFKETGAIIDDDIVGIDSLGQKTKGSEGLSSHAPLALCKGALAAKRPR